MERWRYLGFDFKASGCDTLEQDIKRALTNISRTPLKPQQRLEIMRVHLIPKFLHGFVLGTITDDRLRMLDVQIRSAVRLWLRLPRDVPVGYFHAATKDGGLAIPSLKTGVPELIVKRFGRMEHSRWSAARAAARSDKIRRKLQWANRRLLKLTRTDSHAGERTTAAYWRMALYASNDGFELRETSNTTASTQWMRERSAEITGRDYVQFVHCHINALPSRVRSSRGRRVRGLELNCRAGCAVRETTAHCIQQYHRTHGGRILRHDKVAEVISSGMAEVGWTVVREPKIRTALGLRKPDIIAAKENVGVIVDAQIVSGRQSLDGLHREKRYKYGTHVELVERVAEMLELTGPECVTSTSCTLSWRGVWSPASYKSLRHVGLAEAALTNIPSLVLRGSHISWTRFNQVT